MTLSINSGEGPVELSLYTIGERHFLRSSKYDYFLTLSAYDFHRLAGIDGTRLQGHLQSNDIERNLLELDEGPPQP